MKLFSVTKNNGDTVIVTIIKEKESNKFRFINLTKEHICSCKFDTIEEAIGDMEFRKNNSLIKSYNEIGCNLGFN